MSRYDKPQRNRRKLSPEEVAKLYCQLGKDPDDGLMKQMINDVIGFGVFATKKYHVGDFVLEYAGEYMSKREGQKREQTGKVLGNYLYYCGNFCVDAYSYVSRLGRFVNDSGEPNCRMKAISVEGERRLCLFASQDISIGEELTYDYGVEGLWWRDIPEYSTARFLDTVVQSIEGSKTAPESKDEENSAVKQQPMEENQFKSVSKTKETENSTQAMNLTDTTNHVEKVFESRTTKDTTVEVESINMLDERETALESKDEKNSAVKQQPIEENQLKSVSKTKETENSTQAMNLTDTTNHVEKVFESKTTDTTVEVESTKVLDEGETALESKDKENSAVKQQPIEENQLKSVSKAKETENSTQAMNLTDTTNHVEKVFESRTTKDTTVEVESINMLDERETSLETKDKENSAVKQQPIEENQLKSVSKTKETENSTQAINLTDTTNHVEKVFESKTTDTTVEVESTKILDEGETALESKDKENSSVKQQPIEENQFKSVSKTKETENSTQAINLTDTTNHVEKVFESKTTKDTTVEVESINMLDEGETALESKDEKNSVVKQQPMEENQLKSVSKTKETENSTQAMNLTDTINHVEKVFESKTKVFESKTTDTTVEVESTKVLDEGETSLESKDKENSAVKQQPIEENQLKSVSKTKETENSTQAMNLTDTTNHVEKVFESRTTKDSTVEVESINMLDERETSLETKDEKNSAVKQQPMEENRLMPVFETEEKEYPVNYTANSTLKLYSVSTKSERDELKLYNPCFDRSPSPDFNIEYILGYQNNVMSTSCNKVFITENEIVCSSPRMKSSGDEDKNAEDEDKNAECYAEDKNAECYAEDKNDIYGPYTPILKNCLPTENDQQSSNDLEYSYDYSNQSLRHDSGLYGDFPSIIDTSQEASPRSSPVVKTQERLGELNVQQKDLDGRECINEGDVSSQRSSLKNKSVWKRKWEEAKTKPRKKEKNDEMPDDMSSLFGVGDKIDDVSESTVEENYIRLKLEGKALLKQKLRDITSEKTDSSLFGVGNKIDDVSESTVKENYSSLKLKGKPLLKRKLEDITSEKERLGELNVQRKDLDGRESINEGDVSSQRSSLKNKSVWKRKWEEAKTKPRKKEKNDIKKKCKPVLKNRNGTKDKKNASFQHLDKVRRNIKLNRAAKQGIIYTESQSEDSNDSDSTCSTPSDDETSDSCSSSDTETLVKKTKAVKDPKKKVVKFNPEEQNLDLNESPSDQFDFNPIPCQELHTEEEPSEEICITISRTKKTAAGKRVYDKLHACLFCGERRTKISDHLGNRHATETEVDKAINCKDDKEREKLWDYLRFRGDYYHNCKTLISGGELIVWRRPLEGIYVDYREYMPCQYCLVFVTKAEMWRHIKTCKFKNEKRQSSIKQSELMLFSSKSNCEASDELTLHILNSMNKDDVGRIVLKDPLICMYGSFKLSSGAMNKRRTISERMRLLGKLVREMRALTNQPTSFLQDFVKPEYFDTFIEAVKIIGKYHLNVTHGDGTAAYEKPSNPVKIGYTLHQCVALLRGKAIKINNKELEDTAIRFSTLYELEWSTKVSSAAIRTMSLRRFNKVQLLPVTEDLVKVRSFMKDAIRINLSTLLNNVTLSNWRRLAEILGCRLTIFNRRRANEVYNLKILRFLERDKYKEAEMGDIRKSLSKLEQKISESMKVVHVIGKRGRSVPVLFNEVEEKALQALIDNRAMVGVDEDNLFVFAAPTRGSKLPLRGNDCMRKVIGDIPNLNYPERIKSTPLRKYCATVMQIADLNEQQFRWLANHLGHNWDVHQEYYRLQDSTIALSKVSRMLLAVDEGDSSSFAGKKLSEINIEDLPPLERDINAEETDTDEDNVDDASQPGPSGVAPSTRDIAGKAEVTRATTTSTSSKSGNANKTPWDPAAKKVVLDAFQIHIARSTLPGKAECEKLIRENNVLKGRKWTNLKDCIRNFCKKKKD